MMTFFSFYLTISNPPPPIFSVPPIPAPPILTADSHSPKRKSQHRHFFTLIATPTFCSHSIRLYIYKKISRHTSIEDTSVLEPQGTTILTTWFSQAVNDGKIKFLKPFIRMVFPFFGPFCPRLHSKFLKSANMTKNLFGTF